MRVANDPSGVGDARRLFEEADLRSRSRLFIALGVVHGAVTGSSFDLHRKRGTWGATVTYRIMDAEPPGAAREGHNRQAEAHHGPCCASNWGMLGQALHHMVQGRRRPEKRGEG